MSFLHLPPEILIKIALQSLGSWAAMCSVARCFANDDALQRIAKKHFCSVVKKIDNKQKKKSAWNTTTTTTKITKKRYVGGILASVADEKTKTKTKIIAAADQMCRIKNTRFPISVAREIFDWDSFAEEDNTGEDPFICARMKYRPENKYLRRAIRFAKYFADQHAYLRRENIKCRFNKTSLWVFGTSEIDKANVAFSYDPATETYELMIFCARKDKSVIITIETTPNGDFLFLGSNISAFVSYSSYGCFVENPFAPE